MQCPVCLTDGVTEYSDGRDVARVACHRCGEFEISGTARALLQSKFSEGVHRRALMSHRLRRMSVLKRPVVTSDSLDSFWTIDRLPPPQEQSDDLILLIGDHQLAPEEPIRLAFQYVSAWIGASLLGDKFKTLNWHIRHLSKFGLLEAIHTNYDAAEYSQANPVGMFQLTMAGWDRYAALKKVQINSKVAFMAMKFGDAELDNIVATCFSPAVESTGFHLRRLIDGQGAGLIDDQLRSSILQSRFVLADLSHANNGAYWEAGFAEGLGLPVIYTCSKKKWAEERTHFDTNHMNTIIWDANDLGAAALKLKATIRATLRHEAKQED